MELPLVVLLESLVFALPRSASLLDADVVKVNRCG